jgi:hypothetical protein
MSNHNQHLKETREAVGALRLWVLSELEAELAVTKELLHQSRARVAVLEQAIEAGFVVLDKDNTPSLESFFKKWRKAQTTVSFIVECHKDHAEAIKAGIKMMGGTVK